MVKALWILAGLVLALSACSGSRNATSQNEQESSAMTASPDSSASPMAETTAFSAPTAAPSASGSPLVTVSYTDISSDPNEDAIKDLGSAGVFDTISGPFRPSSPIDRATFVAWLVKANNAIMKDDPSSQIRTSAGGKPVFVDVPASNPNIKYIQSVAKAGYAIGVDNTHFAPARNLTREELIAIEEPVNAGEPPSVEPMPGNMTGMYSDGLKINKRYWAAVFADGQHGIFGRVYGATKLYRPQDPVTRSEAALAISHLHNRDIHTVVYPSASPSP